MIEDRSALLGLALSDHKNTNEFLRLLTLYQSQLHSYLYALLHNMSDTEDVLQNTVVILWKKFDQFEANTNFLRWALRIARFEALKFQREIRRDRKFFSEDLISQLASGPFGNSEENLVFDRRDALTGCIGQLAERDRQLLDSCYQSGVTILDVAASHGRSAQSICNSLRRIRQFLFHCIQRKLTDGKGAV